MPAGCPNASRPDIITLIRFVLQQNLTGRDLHSNPIPALKGLCVNRPLTELVSARPVRKRLWRGDRVEFKKINFPG